MEGNLPKITQLAETVAECHLQGGLIGIIYNNGRWPGQGLPYELHGRSGNMMHIERQHSPSCNMEPQPFCNIAPRKDCGPCLKWPSKEFMHDVPT